MQEAIARWLKAAPEFRSDTETHNYLRRTIDTVTANMASRHPDALDNDPVSLDEE